ncbi:MAG: oligosaccharide flippase family protein, partial [Nitrospinales bacterium]
FDLLNISSVSGTIIGAVSTVYFVLKGSGILALMVILTLQTVYEAVFEAVIVVKIFKIRPSPFDFNRENFKKIFGYSYYAYLIDIASSIFYKIDAVVIGMFLPAASIAFYSIGARIAGILEKIAEPLVDTFFPLASELQTAGDRESLQKLLIQGTKVSTLLIAPGLVLVYWYGADLIGWWIGPDYIKQSLPILEILLASVFFSVFDSTSSRILLGAGKVRFEANVSIFSAGVNLALSLFLVKEYGIAGVAMGTLIPSFISNFLVSAPYTCSWTGTPTLKFYAATLLPVLAVGFISLALIWTIDSFIHERIMSFVLSLIAILAVTILGGIKFGRDR